MVKGPQSAYLILKLFFKTRERRSVSILLYKTREHVIRCEMEMHIKLNLPWGANKDEALPQVFPSDNKKHVQALASQSAKCPLVAKARPRHFTGDSHNWELGGEDRGRSVHPTSPHCTLISSTEGSQPAEEGTSGVGPTATTMWPQNQTLVWFVRYTRTSHQGSHLFVWVLVPHNRS